MLPPPLRSERFDDYAARDLALAKGAGAGHDPLMRRDRPGCGAWWTGQKTNHCTRCHQTFTTVEIGDACHSLGGPCKDPSKVKFHGFPLKLVERGGVLAWASAKPRPVGVAVGV